MWFSINFNSVTIAGRVTRDIEIKQVGKDNIDVANFSLAINRRFGDNEEVDFIDVEAWRKQAEVVAAHKGKGDVLLIKGRLKQDTFEKDGQKRSKLKVVADEIVFGPSKGDGGGGSSNNTTTDDEDSIPF